MTLRTLAVSCVGLALVCGGWVIGGPATAPATVEPPPMPHRAITRPATLPGRTIELDDAGTKSTLFVPTGWRPPTDGRTELAVHFHGAVWFAIDEHVRRGLDTPLVAFYPGEGSRVYGTPFEDADRLARWIGIVEKELGVAVGGLHLTSFSAGYGAIRQIVRHEKYLSRIKTVILADSLYGSWAEASTRPGATSRPADEHVDVWLPLAKRAIEGKCTFVISVSMVPTGSYANSTAMARAVAAKAGLKFVEIAPGTNAAASDERYPLRERAQEGRFCVWIYAGVDAQAHMTHARHIADIWWAIYPPPATRP